MIDSREVQRAVRNPDAMVYPAIRELVDGGYLVCRHEEVEGEREHVCRLSEKGKAAYIATANAWERVR